MLYLSGIILSFFLCFLLFTKRNKTAADFILTAWLGIIGIHLLSFYVLFTGQFVKYPTFVALGFSLPLTHGPFLYLYTRQQTSSDPFQAKELFHFLPLFLSYLLFAGFFLMPLEQKIEVFRQAGKGYETQSRINIFAINISGIVYSGLSIARLLKYRKNLVHQFSNTDKINFNWLLYLIIWIVLIWITIIFVQKDQWIFGMAALFVLWLGYFGIKQVRVFSQNAPLLKTETSSTVQRNMEDKRLYGQEIQRETEALASEKESENLKYQKSTLSERDASEIHARLERLMAEQKPFKNPDLTLNELANSLDVHPNHLSQVINSRVKKTFYELINDRRVEEFILLSGQPESQQFTLLSLAHDCGFNSKASFNRNFKKYTGLSPREYLKRQLTEA
ncbi:MAG TPA: helix-turn-helix domain-containing protein [Saprospiraceae bacterium]|nr:helix-turn-helix domain-containing protein [Saprospiraceae bacterium]HNT20393.1 helix-turn-helix domain-containing protein [Saprospiraceae bacterium]